MMGNRRLLYVFEDGEVGVDVEAAAKVRQGSVGFAPLSRSRSGRLTAFVVIFLHTAAPERKKKVVIIFVPR